MAESHLSLVPPPAPPAPRPLQPIDLDALIEARALAQEAADKAMAVARESLAAVHRIEDELVARMNDANARRLPHTHFRIALEVGSPKLDKRESEFLAILDLPDIPQREKQEMVARVPQAPKLVTDAAKLKKYAKQYGENHPLWAIMQRALVYGDAPAKLVIEPVEPPKIGLQP